MLTNCTPAFQKENTPHSTAVQHYLYAISAEASFRRLSPSSMVINFLEAANLLLYWLQLQHLAAI